jgi:hypothetical protein
VNGSRPGPASKLSPLTEYCRQRLADDPHLRNLDLLKEIASLGYQGALTTFAGSLNSYRLTRPRCTQCEASPVRAIAGMRITCPVVPDGQLPMPARPLAGEMLASYLGRLAAANHLHLLTLLAIMPRWLTGKITSHRARLPGSELIPAAAESLHQLAALTGAPATAIACALPVFGGGPKGPARAITACRRCAAARGITQPVPVHQPACEMACTRHGIWLPRAGQPQLDVTACPEIIIAEHHARRLLRHCTPEQLIHARLKAAQIITRSPQAAGETYRGWHQRTGTLRAGNPGLNTPAAEHELTQAATYPGIIAISAMLVASSPAPGPRDPGNNHSRGPAPRHLN